MRQGSPKKVQDQPEAPSQEPEIPLLVDQNWELLRLALEHIERLGAASRFTLNDIVAWATERRTSKSPIIPPESSTPYATAAIEALVKMEKKTPGTCVLIMEWAERRAIATKEGNTQSFKN